MHQAFEGRFDNEVAAHALRVTGGGMHQYLCGELSHLLAHMAKSNMRQAQHINRDLLLITGTEVRL